MTQPVNGYGEAGPPARVLQLIRMSLVTGMLLFGGVIYYVHSRPGWEKHGAPEGLGYAVLGAWAVVAALMFLLLGRYRNAPTRAARASMAIAGWAVGEGAAMAGGVYYFMTDDVTRFIGGLLIFFAALSLFPIPPDDEARR
jgi:hypothetical protein